KNAPGRETMKMQRRVLLQAAGIIAAGVSMTRRSLADTQEASAAVEPPPTHQAPPLAADCHIHIYDSRFPTAPNAMLLPPDAHIDDYLVVQRRLGTARTVLVQPSTYGTDNRCMLHALARMGAAARGIAVVDADVTDAELQRLAAAGVHGIRF